MQGQIKIRRLSYSYQLQPQYNPFHIYNKTAITSTKKLITSVNVQTKVFMSKK